MIRKMLSYGGTLLLVGATAVAMPGTGLAQRGGGGHGGGGHFGGAHFSGGNFSGARFGGGHVGGAHVGSYYGGYHHGGYGHVYSGYGRYGYGYYPHYGYYPYYDYYPDTYGGYSYDWPSPNYDSGYSSFYTGPYGDDTDLAAPATNRVRHECAGYTSPRDHKSAGRRPRLGRRRAHDFDRPSPAVPIAATAGAVEVTPGAHVEVDFTTPPRSRGKGSMTRGDNERGNPAVRQS